MILVPQPPRQSSPRLRPYIAAPDCKESSQPAAGAHAAGLLVQSAVRGTSVLLSLSLLLTVQKDAIWLAARGAGCKARYLQWPTDADRVKPGTCSCEASLAWWWGAGAPPVGRRRSCRAPAGNCRDGPAQACLCWETD